MVSKITFVNRGVVGYQGAVPNSSSLLIDTKGSTRRQPAEKLIDEKTKQELRLAKDDSHISSEYRRRYNGVGTYKPVVKEGGGYWFSQRQLQESKPFTSVSTYRAEVEHGGNTTRDQLVASEDLRSTLSQYESAVRYHAGEGGQEPGSLTAKWDGEVLGYQTEYNSMTVKEPLSRSAPPTRSRAKAAAERGEIRHKVLPRAMFPRLNANTTYHENFGTCGSDPLARTAGNEREMTQTASTRYLGEGTTRNTYQIPGYAGFLPESTYNPHARKQAEGLCTRTDEKVDMLLYHLDQYSRTRVPHYTGYKPQGNRNITVTQPSRGPAKGTTQGAAGCEVAAQPLKPVDNSLFLNGRKGLMSFFTGGGAFVSDNGESEAQQFYRSLKPLEGLPKIDVASKTTLYGARFVH